MSTALAHAPMTRALTIKDRCDRCSAQAYVAVDIKGSELLFCGHHGSKYSTKLEEIGAVITADARDSLRGEDRLKGSHN